MGGILSMVGQGLSAAGNSVAQFAGDAAVLQQKADYERQAMTLADSLATTRETGLEQLRQKGAVALAQTEQAGRKELAGINETNAETLARVTSNLSVEANQKEAANALANLPLTAAANDKILQQRASDPQYIKSVRTLADASATPEQRAAAEKYRADAALAAVQTSAAKELQDAKALLNNAVQSGDRGAVAQAKSRLAIAKYSSHDEVQRAASLNAAATQSRLNLQAIQHDLDAAQSNLTAAFTPEHKAEVERLTSELEAARSDYATVSAMSLNAARNLPDFNVVTGNSGSGATPDLSKYFRKPGAAAPAPAGQ